MDTRDDAVLSYKSRMNFYVSDAPVIQNVDYTHVRKFDAAGLSLFTVASYPDITTT
jgi:hypothetical protein